MIVHSLVDEGCVQLLQVEERHEEHERRYQEEEEWPATAICVLECMVVTTAAGTRLAVEC